MSHSFDIPVSRLETQAIKWDMLHTPGSHHLHRTERFASGDVLPMWVADMDFSTAPPITAALQQRLNHPVYGYTHTPDSYRASVCDWMRRRQGWTPRPEWICTTHGVVQALNLSVRAFSQPGDTVIIPAPVYYPFATAVTGNGRTQARSPLNATDTGAYTFDLTQITSLASNPTCSMLLLCNPHNPGGRAWDEEELSALAQICAEYQVTVISDEIHADLTLPGHRFTPFLPIAQQHDCQAVICTSASKTFNLAGLATSEIFLPSPSMRTAFRQQLASAGIFGPHLLGPIATEAAYTECADWHTELLLYLEAGHNLVRHILAPLSGRITPIPQEATYLVWLDCRGLGLDDQALAHAFMEKARVYPESGTLYGPEGRGFMRLNIACPHTILETALTRIVDAFS
jgi:cystathionine beta-lyase